MAERLDAGKRPLYPPKRRKVTDPVPGLSRIRLLHCAEKAQGHVQVRGRKQRARAAGGSGRRRKSLHLHRERDKPIRSHPASLGPSETSRESPMPITEAFSESLQAHPIYTWTVARRRRSRHRELRSLAVHLGALRPSPEARLGPDRECHRALGTHGGPVADFIRRRLLHVGQRVRDRPAHPFRPVHAPLRVPLVHLPVPNARRSQAKAPRHRRAGIRLQYRQRLDQRLCNHRAGPAPLEHRLAHRPALHRRNPRLRDRLRDQPAVGRHPLETCENRAKVATKSRTAASTAGSRAPTISARSSNGSDSRSPPGPCPPGSLPGSRPQTSFRALFPTIAGIASTSATTQKAVARSSHSCSSP